MPEYFAELVGHDHVKYLLSSALDSGRIGHAYIFCGPKGVGRYTAASEFAKSAVGTSKRVHPDIITVSNEWCGLESKSDTILADTVSEMRKDIYIKPYSGSRKVYIVPKGDTMNTASQNKLLKVFEEPPPYCTIILIAENLSRFLPTVLSRASVVRFSPLAESTVAKYLIERRVMDAEEAGLKAAISGGSIGEALTLLNNPEPEQIRSRIIDGLVSLSESGGRNMIEFSNYLKTQKDNMDFVFSLLRSFLNDLVHIKLGLEDNIVNKDKSVQLNRLASAATENAAVQMLDIAVRYERVYKTNANFRMTMFCMACELWEELHGRNYRSTV